ncbi:DUF4179 domain-containing protein [Alicyclobacillus sp. ALC3]|uniref:DUF4179 domain-containing protein n=1 Tax=Alicyclobacillus sp. ALC3 TaxID=2796143 RepID=UPI0023798B2C|nr:DUF4179 domain-containing protein [Alicyclobacillus sp. ALC3]WDL98879.1 DUF4179 domain-containing protein [Alicyclobacillus sp. ALC3]
MKSDIQHSLESVVSNVEPSVTFEKVWTRFNHDERMNKRSLNKYLRRGVASVAIGVLGLIGSGLGLSLISSNIAYAMDKTPIINQVYDWFGDPGLNQAGVFTDKVHISSTDRGITFTATDVYDDQGRVALEYQLNSPSGALGKTAIAPNMDFYMNGKLLNMTSGGAAGSVSNREWHGVNEIFPESTNQTFPKNFDLQIVIHQIGNTHGYWEVQVPVSGTKEFHNTTTYTPNVTKTSNGIALGIDQVSITPATVVVDYHYTIERGQNVHLYLNGSSGKTVMIPDLAGPTHKSFNGNKETVYGFSVFEKPINFGKGIKILPENDPAPAPGATTSPSIELPSLDMIIPLG